MELMLEEFTKIAELGGTVFVVSAFLFYLYIKNGKTEKNQEKIATVLDKQAEALDRQTRVLMKVSRSHGLHDDANDLMMGRRN